MSTPEPDDLETYLRQVMQSRDTRPAGFTAGEVVAGGRRRRRSRAVAASGLALVAFAAVLGVGVGASDLAGGQGRGGYDPGVTPATVSPTAPAAPFTAAPAGPPRVVTSPGTVDIGDGFRLKVTADSVELTGQGSVVGPDYVESKNPGSISMMAAGRGVASLYSGTSPGHVATAVATAVVTVDGRSYPATILRLAGHDDWSAAFVVLPEGVSAGQDSSVTVYDAAGHPLATAGFQAP